MTVTVRSTTGGRSVSVTQGSQSVGSVVVKRADNLTVEGLTNVVSTDLQDGYTLVYDADTDKWIAQQLEAGAIGAVDGGTY